MILKSERHKVNAKDHFKGGACKSRLALLLFLFYSECEDEGGEDWNGNRAHFEEISKNHRFQGFMI